MGDSGPFWLNQLPNPSRWPRLTALVKLSSERRIWGIGEVSRESRYYICSKPLDAADALTATRTH